MMRSEIDSLVKKLKDNNLISIHNDTIAQSVSRSEIDALINKYKKDYGNDYFFEFSPEVLDWYAECNGFEIFWSLSEKSGINFLNNKTEDVWGRIRLYGFQQVMENLFTVRGKKILKLYSPELEETTDQREIAPPASPFDYYHPNYSECACLDIDKNRRISDKIVLASSVNGEAEIASTDWSINSYVKEAMSNYGIYHWQAAVNYKDTYERKRIDHYLSEIFS